MSNRSVEARLATLESRVARLQEEVNTGRRSAKDWRRTIGIFTEDGGMKEILREALKLREQDRKQTRAKSVTRRKRKQ